VFLNIQNLLKTACEPPIFGLKSLTSSHNAGCVAITATDVPVISAQIPNNFLLFGRFCSWCCPSTFTFLIKMAKESTNTRLLLTTIFLTVCNAQSFVDVS
jgi:hypothetical protein